MVSANPTITGNIFRDSVGAAISMDLQSNPAITGFTATNNMFNGLLVDSGTISGSRQWNDPDIIYVLSGVNEDMGVRVDGATVTLLAMDNARQWAVKTVAYDI